MRRFFLLFAFMVLTAPVFAQDAIVVEPLAEENSSVAAEDTTTDTTSEAVEPATQDDVAKDITAPTENPDLKLKDDKIREFEDAPILRLRILDKVRAESRTYELNVGRTVAYANLRIRPRACRKSSPLDEPESAAFLQIWEVKPDESSAWVFSGWMFASSPSLSAMDHPVYDVTVLECKLPVTAEPAPEEEAIEEPVVDEDQDASDTGAQESTNETPEEPSADSSNE